jgi:hypothetical protein
MKTKIEMLKRAAMLCLVATSVCFHSCQQDEDEPKVVYGTDIYELKSYKIPRMPTVMRGGWGMDIYHLGNSSHDSTYFDVAQLPAYHPNNPVATGAVVTKPDAETNENVKFEYDLLFYNEMGYSLTNTGDYTSKGNPVIFMYTDAAHAGNSTQATIVGYGVAFFNTFTYADITKAITDNLKADPLVALASYRTELHTATVDGAVTLEDDIYPFYATLTIGNKFRPAYADWLPAGNNPDEIDKQAVFLIKTREGLYAKFMVTDFQGTGADTQMLTLQWQALKAE